MNNSLRVYLVCGSRHVSDSGFVADALSAHGSPPRLVVHGGAKGADSLAGAWANTVASANVKVFMADWELHGKAAGPIRNQQMLDYIRHLRASGYEVEVIAFPQIGKKSAGTFDMIKRAASKCFTVTIYPVPKS